MQSEAVQGDPHFIHKTGLGPVSLRKSIFCLRTLIITMFTLCSFAFEWVITLNWHNELLGTENVVSRRHIFSATNKLRFQRARKDSSFDWRKPKADEWVYRMRHKCVNSHLWSFIVLCVYNERSFSNAQLMRMHVLILMFIFHFSAVGFENGLVEQ